MTRDDAEWNRLERSHLKWWSRAQQLMDVILSFRIDECWCDQPLGEHTEPCMRAQRAMEAYK
jgi:hypothetical protein